MTSVGAVGTTPYVKNQYTKKGAKIGAAVGVASVAATSFAMQKTLGTSIYGLYKDLGTNVLKNKKLGVAGYAAALGLTIAGYALNGAIIGKIVDVVKGKKAKKAEKAAAQEAAQAAAQENTKTGKLMSTQA